MKRVSLDEGWRFTLSDQKAGAVRHLDDSSWRRVDLPHDWSIECPRRADAPTGPSGGYAQEGIGWYRRHFHVPAAWKGKRVLVEFEGVYRDAEVWLNGHALGVHPYGYTSFHMDLTPFLAFEEENLLAVQVCNTPAGHTRWYSGSGIYRHVWLRIADPVHLAPWGLWAVTRSIEKRTAHLEVAAPVENHDESETSLTVRWRLLDPDGRVAAEARSDAITVPAGGSVEARQTLTVRSCRLWSPETPHLYRIEAELVQDRRVLDRDGVAVGIRTLALEPEVGFRLNGETIKMRGGCVHHDCGPLGAAAVDRAEERKVERLKANGFNAVRCAHNPPSPAFLDACDRLGMMVIDEAFDCWRAGKNPFDYHRWFDRWWLTDLDSMVLRDRHHPAVVAWSIGNELIERDKPEGAPIARRLADRIRQLDPTRPITAGICDVWEKERRWEATDPVFDVLDLCGYNYRLDVYERDHQRFPRRLMAATESFPPQQFEYWKAVERYPWVVGDFVWTAWDYLGEAGIGHVRFADAVNPPFLPGWPYTVANCGDLDLCGHKRPQSYYRDVLWGRAERPVIVVHPPVPEGMTVVVSQWGWEDVRFSWNWPGHEGKTFKVEVYFNSDEIELLLNGRSIGRAPAGEAARYRALFDVPYEPGELRAVAWRGGKAIAVGRLVTAGAPSRLRLTPDRRSLRPDRNDLAFVDVELVDRRGIRIPDASEEILFSVQGPGRIAAVANADPTNAEPFRGHSHRLWRGRALAVVQPTGRRGTITLRAITDGLPAATVSLAVQP